MRAALGKSARGIAVAVTESCRIAPKMPVWQRLFTFSAIASRGDASVLGVKYCAAASERLLVGVMPGLEDLRHSDEEQHARPAAMSAH